MQAYDDWFQSTFNANVLAPGTLVATSWSPETKWGHRAHCALLDIEVDYVKELIGEIRDNNVPGCFAEFGIFEGWWVSRLWELTEEAGLDRKVYGFDSFQGLSDPHPDFDTDAWRKGQYACGLEEVRRNVKATERPRIQLVEGFFEQSLLQPVSQSVKQICFARIDCDIYEPALQCLRYLGPRLSDGAILVFDDWPYQLGIGEQRAFAEWAPEAPHLNFEFLFYNTFRHLYLRVRHR